MTTRLARSDWLVTTCYQDKDSPQIYADLRGLEASNRETREVTQKGIVECLSACWPVLRLGSDHVPLPKESVLIREIRGEPLSW